MAIQCAFSTDNNYCQHLGVTLASLWVNNSHHQFHFHIIHSHVSTQNMARIRQIIAGMPNVSASFYLFDAARYAHFRLDDHISIASYFRLFLPEILPDSIDRLLYFDADLVILDDLRDLWEMPLEGALIGAVPDPFANLVEPRDGSDVASNVRLGLPKSHVYANAGVLNIDLRRWRELRLVDVFVRFVETNHQILRYHDQDALNAVLTERIKYLPYKWNFQAKTTPKQLEDINAHYPSEADKTTGPAIIHYTTSKKPWFYNHDVNYKSEYYKYLKQTPWRLYVPPDRTVRRIVARRLPGVSKAWRWVRGKR